MQALQKHMMVTKECVPSDFEDHLPESPKTFNQLDDSSLHPTLELEADSMVRLQVMRDITLLRLDVEKKV